MIKQKDIDDIRGWQKHLRRTAEDENMSNSIRRKIRYRVGLLDRLVLEIKGDHPFPDDFTALDLCVERNKALLADNERLRAAARKTLKERDEADDHHSAACMNWSSLEHSQHQCGLCDLREALREDEDA